MCSNCEENMSTLTQGVEIVFSKVVVGISVRGINLTAEANQFNFINLFIIS